MALTSASFRRCKAKLTPCVMIIASDFGRCQCPTSNLASLWRTRFAQSYKILVVSQVKAVEAAKDSGKVVHPLMDQVRLASSTPDAAADFFTQLLHPTPHMRPTAADPRSSLHDRML